MNEPASESVFRILLAEDAPDQSLLLSALLQKLGPFDVTLVQDGLQALELARRESFDLILTDLNLPGIDGFELTRALKKEFPRLPVLAATGYTDASYVSGAYRAGADALMTKPVDPEDLEARLRELLPRWRTGDEKAPAVIAFGARPGDVELGCGASLAAHQAAGHDVLVVVLLGGNEEERIVERSRRAAKDLAVRLLFADAVSTSPEGLSAQLARIVAEMQPTWAYLPSAADRDEQRRRAHELALRATRGVTTVLGYATSTSSLGFAPSVYRDVGRWMDTKVSSLSFHHAGHAPDPGLSPDFALAHARYWGRFKGFAAVEPFELLGGDEGQPPPESAERSSDTAPSAPESVAAAEVMPEPAPHPVVDPAPPAPAEPVAAITEPAPERAPETAPAQAPEPTRERAPETTPELEPQLEPEPATMEESSPEPTSTPQRRPPPPPILPTRRSFKRPGSGSDT